MIDRTKGLDLKISPGARPFEARSLAPAIGMEILGVDCGSEVDEGTFRRIEKLWHDNCVILIRGQNLDEAQQWNFARRFGETGRVHHNHNGGSKLPGVMYISNVRENGKLIGSLPDGEMFFHHDQCYIEKPAIATMLYAMEVPSIGGNTIFSNMFAAYDALPADIKSTLDGLKAMHVYDYQSNPTTRGAEIKDGTPHYAHPIVRVHPGNDRRAIYVNRLMTDHIVGMNKKESDQLLEYLFDHSEQPQFLYEHVWEPGDVLVWDNRSCTHARTDFSATERRLMRRVAIVG